MENEVGVSWIWQFNVKLIVVVQTSEMGKCSIILEVGDGFYLVRYNGSTTSYYDKVWYLMFSCFFVSLYSIQNYMQNWDKWG